MQKEALDKATQIGKISASGSLYLFIGRILSTVISAIGTIILSALILQSDYGLYTVALIPITTILLFQDWGVSYAISRQSAQCKANQNEGELRKTILAGFTFEIIIAILLTVISILTANFIASAVFNQPDSSFLMIVASATILSTAILSVSQSIFVGFENMKILSLISLLQAIVQCIVAPVLVFLGYGALGAMIGYVLTTIAGCVVSMTVFYFFFYRKIPRINVYFSEILETLKPMLRFGIPLAVGSILGGLLIRFDFFLMASYVNDLTLIGNYKTATNFAILLTFFTFPIATVLFPAFSKVDPKKEIRLIKTLFASSIKYTALVVVPATMILILLSAPIIGALYGNKWPYAPEFLSYTVLISLFTCLGSTVATPFFSALGETKLLLKTNIVYLVTGLPIAMILIPWAGITGMIIVPIIAGIPQLLIYLYMAKKKFDSTVHYVSSAKIFLSSLLSATITYLFVNMLSFSYWVQLVVGLIVFLLTYLFLISFIGALNEGDVSSLRTMFGSFGAVSKILKIPLDVIGKLIKIRVMIWSRLKKQVANSPQKESPT